MKPLANTTLKKKYHSFKTSNIELIHLNKETNLKCESLFHFFRNLNFCSFYSQSMLNVVASWETYWFLL